jgi:hypothetical protein
MRPPTGGLAPPGLLWISFEHRLLESNNGKSHSAIQGRLGWELLVVFLALRVEPSLVAFSPVFRSRIVQSLFTV